MVEQIVACICLGICLITAGIWMQVHKTSTIVHPRYLKHVQTQDIPMLSTLCGVGITLMGMACLCLVPSLLLKSYWFEAGGIGMLFGGLALTLLSIAYFNRHT